MMALTQLDAVPIAGTQVQASAKTTDEAEVTQPELGKPKGGRYMRKFEVPEDQANGLLPVIQAVGDTLDAAGAAFAPRLQAMTTTSSTPVDDPSITSSAKQTGRRACSRC